MARILWTMPPESPTGWGNLSANLKRELEAAGEIVTTNFEEDADYQVVAIADVTFKPIGQFHPTAKKIGIGFCEFDQYARDNAYPNIGLYDHVICGSQWMMNLTNSIIRNNNLQVSTSFHIQGVNHDVFKWKERRRGGYFCVGTFGKYEFRKGQDIAIAAFSEFAKSHEDVILRASLHNPWPMTMMSPPGVKTAYKVEGDLWLRGDSQASYFTKLIMGQGIPADKIWVDDQASSSAKMAEIYNGCDVAIFPNRIEAGSNLCLQEAISCGVPCIATLAHGHLNLGESFSPLWHVDLRCDGNGNSYYEPCFSDCVIALEKAYQNRLGLDMGKIKEISDTWTWKALADHVRGVSNG